MFASLTLKDSKVSPKCQTRGRNEQEATETVTFCISVFPARDGQLLQTQILIGQEAQLSSSCLIRLTQQTSSNALIGYYCTLFISQPFLFPTTIGPLPLETTNNRDPRLIKHI